MKLRTPTLAICCWPPQPVGRLCQAIDPCYVPPPPCGKFC